MQKNMHSRLISGLLRPGRYLSILTGISQVILSAQKTGENGGVTVRNPGYTYYCAEEPTSQGTCNKHRVDCGTQHGT